MKPLFILLIATAAFAGINEQIIQARAGMDSCTVILHNLSSKRYCSYLDSLSGLDSTLAADNVKYKPSTNDSMYVKMVLSPLSNADRKTATGALKGAEVKFTKVSADTLYMRRDRAEKALPVISAALRE